MLDRRQGALLRSKRSPLPGFDPQLAHGEVLHVRCGEGSRDSNCGRSDEAVGLVQGGPRCGKVATPRPGEAAFGNAERCQPKAAEQPHSVGFLLRVEPAPDLLDRDGAHPWLSSQASQSGDSIGGRTASKSIDEHGRVEQQSRHYPARRPSASRCARTHVAGSSSQACPESGSEPRADSTSSQRRSSSSA